MTKTIKFNLILDGKPVRDLEGLQNNYNLDDILAYHKSGVLSRWLDVRGYKDHLQKIEKLETADEMALAKELSTNFEVGLSDEDIEKAVYDIQFQKIRNNNKGKEKSGPHNDNEIISEYHKEYVNLENRIIRNKENFTLIKQSVQQIAENYGGLFHYSHKEFYYRMIKEAPLAIFAVLLNDKLKNYFCIKPQFDNELDRVFDEKIGKLIDANYITGSKKLFIDEQNGVNLFDDSDHYLKRYFKIHSESTNKLWKNIEPQNKKCMIIHIKAPAIIRNSAGKEFSHFDIKGNFLTLDGVDYQNPSPFGTGALSFAPLIYMEV